MLCTLHYMQRLLCPPQASNVTAMVTSNRVLYQVARSAIASRLPVINKARRKCLSYIYIPECRQLTVHTQHKRPAWFMLITYGMPQLQHVLVIPRGQKNPLYPWTGSKTGIDLHNLQIADCRYLPTLLSNN